MHSNQRVSHSARQKLNFLRTNHAGQPTGPFLSPFLFFHVYSFTNHLDPFPFPDFGSSPKPVSLNISRCSSPHSRMRPILQVVTPPCLYGAPETISHCPTVLVTLQPLGLRLPWDSPGRFWVSGLWMGYWGLPNAVVPLCSFRFGGTNFIT